MRKLTIEAASLESAHRLRAALTSFAADFGEAEDGAYRVTVALDGSHRIVAVLHAIEEHLRSRAEGPALIGLDGESYTLGGGDGPVPTSPGADSPRPHPGRNALRWDGTDDESRAPQLHDSPAGRPHALAPRGVHGA